MAAHDLRIALRDFLGRFGRLSAPVATVVAVGTVLGLHVLAWPVAGWIGANDRGSSSPAFSIVALLIMPWLMSQAINGSARALYARGDLDLILSAPVSSRAALATRCLAIAVESLLSILIFAGPVADVAALRGGPRWLSIYPALAASALLATGFGVVAAFALFWAVGPRRTRLLAQLSGAAVGAVFVLALQAAGMAPSSMRARLFSALAPTGDQTSFSVGILGLPVRAASGDIGALALWGLIAVGVFLAAIGLCGGAFVRFAAQAGAFAERKRGAGRPRRLAFKSGSARVLRAKEWRLLRRDPWLVSQILLQIVYTLPIGVLLWRSEGLHGSVALSAGPTLVVIACQISASFAWLVVSSEEAPELLQTAPVTRRAIEFQKFQTIAPPLAALLGPPLLALAWFEPRAAALVALFAGGAAACSALLNFWHPKPGRRREVLRRHAQSKLVGLMEHLLSLAWAVAVVLALIGSSLALVPIVFSGLLLYINWPERRSRKNEDAWRSCKKVNSAGPTK